MAAFRLLNGPLADAGGWQLFWALVNKREIDLLSGCLAAIVMIWWLWGRPRDVQNRRTAALGSLAVPLLILPFMANYFVRFVVSYQRPSPSLVFDDALRLTSLVPHIDTKDATLYSFPGDHAFILVSIVLFYWYLAPRKFMLVSLVLALMFSLPRLVGGAHWLSDDIIGGIVPALLVTSWILATPFGHLMIEWLLPSVNRIISLLPAWLRIPDHTA